VSEWYTVKDGDRNVRVAIAADSTATWVFVEGHVWRIEKNQAANRRSRPRGDASVMAPMPATVVAINTAAGSSVSEGDTVIVLEAMKRELPIKAPRGGMVRAVNCATGELVQPGVNLVEIE
jgi:acetyl/propionyl-CoA carboxylase alpha subunit